MPTIAIPNYFILLITTIREVFPITKIIFNPKSHRNYLKCL